MYHKSLQQRLLSIQCTSMSPIQKLKAIHVTAFMAPNFSKKASAKKREPNIFVPHNLDRSYTLACMSVHMHNQLRSTHERNIPETTYMYMSSAGARTYHKLLSGKFTSIVCHKERVYAAAYHASQVWIFMINNDACFKLVLIEKVVIPDGWTTLSVKKHSILCCNRESGEIYILPCYLNGSDTPIPSVSFPTPHDAATGGDRYICDDDDDTVMICDRRHNRIELLTNWSQLSTTLVVDTGTSCVAALKDRKTNFLFVVQGSPNVLTIHHGVRNFVEATSNASNDPDDLD